MAKDKSLIEGIKVWLMILAMFALAFSFIYSIFVPQKTMCIETLNATEPISVERAATLNDAIPFFNRCTSVCRNAFSGSTEREFECLKLCFDKIQVKDEQVTK